MAWKMTHNNKEVGFEVLGIEPADKDGYVATSVKYPTTDKVYKYIRKYTIKNYEGSTIVDGCDVRFDPFNYTLHNVTRIYDTKGMKKKTNPGGVKVGGAIKSIKDEMVEKEIEAPKVVEIPNGPVHHEQ